MAEESGDHESGRIADDLFDFRRAELYSMRLMSSAKMDSVERPASRVTADADIVKKFNRAQDRLVIQAADLSLDTIATMVAREAIDIAPSFQRRERWATQKQSALIESFLLNVPVPPVYLMEDDYGTYSVIDGKQRIMAISSFMAGQLQLVDLRSFKEINGLRFASLPRPLKNALQVRPYIRVITLLRQSDSDLKYEVFTRLNEGGEPLNPQELRNVAFRGPTNDLIFSLADDPFLKMQLKIKNHKSPAYQQMDDAEFVLRFLMLESEWKHFSGDFRYSMDHYMRVHQHATKDEIKGLEHQFRRSVYFTSAIWGTEAFKRPSAGGWRDQMLAGMYDAQMVGVAQVSDKQLEHAADQGAEVLERTRDLFKDKRFEEAVRIATNTPSRVAYRIQRVSEILENV